MSDDLTQPPNSGPPASGGFDANHPTIISLCYLGSFITGITGIVGIVLAYVWKDDAADWERSHYTYLIRTFWIGLIGSVISFVLMIVLIGFLTGLAVAVWVAVRSVMSLVKAQKREPMPDPETLLF
ncbi:MAG: hypothetical protein R3D99_02480 [Altererythrobacter sp.]